MASGGPAEASVRFRVGDGDVPLDLAGLLAPPDGAAGPAPGGLVAAAPHPLYGGSMDHPVVGALVRTGAAMRRATLRFDWRGVGSSGGEPSGSTRDARDDYGAALGYLEGRTAGPIAATGYSFGAAAAVAASAADARVDRLVLVAPPPSLVERPRLEGFAGRIAIVTGQEDDLAPPAALERLVAGLARAEFVCVPGVDHYTIGLGPTLAAVLGDLLA